MHIAVLGATGAVGRTMLEVLEARNLPVDRLTLFASERSAGRTIPWKGRDHTVEVPRPGAFRGVDYAIFSAGGERSLEWALRAADEGAVVVDNSSAWRMDPAVPLVVPEVNGEAARNHPKGVIANPNCSTIQMVVALKPLDDAAGLSRVVVTTFQSVSGAGEKGKEALRHELAGDRTADTPFTRTIAGNAVPQIGGFDAAGCTVEERKMVDETRKILAHPELPVTATCVRVPVEVGHSVQLMVETERHLPLAEAARALERFPGITFAREAEDFPTALDAAGRDEVFIGRLRADEDVPAALHLWVVADNLRKGAATNAVQIVELLSGG